jgi:tRNA(fMet)-specific endonuclease VapC
VSKVVLDTDILSEILKGKDATVAARARAYRAEHGRYTLTVIAVLEIVRGLRRVQSLSRLDAFMDSLSSDEVLDLDVEAAVLAGEIDSRLTGTGRPIGTADVIVAAIALRHGLALATGNESHYGLVRDAGYPLSIENWRRA